MHCAVTPIQSALDVELLGGQVVAEGPAFVAGMKDGGSGWRGGDVCPQSAPTEGVEVDLVGDQVTGNSVGQVARDLIDQPRYSPVFSPSVSLSTQAL